MWTCAAWPLGLANSLKRSPTFPCTPMLIHLFGWLYNINEHNEGRNPVWFPLCLQHSAQSMSHNHYSSYRFIEWINKWQDHYTHSNFLISFCCLVSLDTIPSIPALDSGQKSFGNLSSLVPTEKMINLNNSWGLRNQTWLLKSQQRFSQCAITFFPFGKLAICYCPSRRYAMERNGQGLGRGPWWIAGYGINWQLMSPSSESPHQVGFELVTSSPTAGIRFLCGKLMEFCACSCLLTHSQALLAWAPGSLSFLKASNPLFKLTLAFNCHKGNLPKGFFQIQIKRKRLKWTQLFVSVLIF